jgi:hypothetical protein
MDHSHLSIRPFGPPNARFAKSNATTMEPFVLIRSWVYHWPTWSVLTLSDDGHKVMQYFSRGYDSAEEDVDEEPYFDECYELLPMPIPGNFEIFYQHLNRYCGLRFGPHLCFVMNFKGKDIIRLDCLRGNSFTTKEWLDHTFAVVRHRMFLQSGKYLPEEMWDVIRRYHIQ